MVYVRVKLSAVEVDVDKDWGGRRIMNVGAPIDMGDAARKRDTIKAMLMVV